MESAFVRASLLQERVGAKIRCHVCERRCLIVPGGFGWCRTRENCGGKLVTLIYGAASSVAANPIEKKPFYHFYPGTHAFTVGSWSCNFACPWCQNWDISKAPPPRTGEYLSPERFVAMTENAACQGTSISFNEPTLSLEWSLEVFRLARKRGLYNTYVTNGYMTPEALYLLIDAGLDAMNVDVKGDAGAVKRFCKGVDIEKVWAACKLARLSGMHVEITTLVIPSVNDAEATLREIAARIVTDLGPEVPWHVSAYHPAYRFTALPTPMRSLERAWQIGKEAGLEFVYVGNLPGHRHDNTYCPACGALLIQRLGFDVRLYAVRDGFLPTMRATHCGCLAKWLNHPDPCGSPHAPSPATSPRRATGHLARVRALNGGWQSRGGGSMEFFEVIKARRSLRAFTAQPIELEKQRAILETANCAPSAGNLQAYEIYAVTSQACLKALSRAAGRQRFIAKAPLALVFYAHPARSAKEYGLRGTSLYCVQDATIACAYAQLAATALGLASVWVGAFDEGPVRTAIGVGDELLPVAILPIGYAGEEPEVTSRRLLGDLVHDMK